MKGSTKALSQKIKRTAWPVPACLCTHKPRTPRVFRVNSTGMTNPNSIMKPELAPPHANSLILSPKARVSCLLVHWGSGWWLPSPPLLAAVLTSKDCALCPAALGSQPPETLLQPRRRLITHLATPLFRGRKCHMQLQNLSCPMEERAVKGPEPQELQERGGPCH